MPNNTNIPTIKSSNLFPVVGIGASAGGLDAFKKLLKAITTDSGMAYVLVQHLDPNHDSLLPEILQKVTKIPVLEISHDIKVEPNHIYVIPSNKMMVATDGVLLLANRPAKSTTERNLPIDLFFTSLAEVHQEHAIGVVLSGTASDGTKGLKAIKEHGGITFAQDEASAEYDSMPQSAILAGVVDFILPPQEIPKKLLAVTNKTILSDEELQNIPKEEEDVFRQILSLLRIRKGVDFTYYKQTTIRRRILRRMVVNKNEEPAEYLKFLRLNNQEQDLLYQDILIPVTSFFRDKKVFDDLCNNVFPTILANKIPGEITRIWVAGCSTGQEVYSIAICFKEFLGDNHERIQIFGTDLSEPAILKARMGNYEKNEIEGVSPERLKEYFTRTNGSYQVNKSIRDMCVFAHHNFLKDPPFGKMDVISCRNVLIYMEAYLQKKALTTFHYALNNKGFLLLGKSETTGGVPELYTAVEKADKLYTRKDAPGRFMQVASQRSEQILNRPTDSFKNDPVRTDFQKTADEILLTKYTPGGVVVNDILDIVHFRGNTANYLEQAAGKPSHNLLTMAKNGLGFELRNILHKAKTDKKPVIKENIPLSVNGHLRNISIEAVPLPNTVEPYYLVLFHDNNVIDNDGSVIGNKKKVSARTKKDEKELQIKMLEQQLAQIREDMRSITEDQEASNEELQSANEELLSGSEELQSLNEELETSKEELQSTNEELMVLNHELLSLNEQVTDARNYSESIVSTLYQPLLVLDKHLRVKTANQSFYKTFQVNQEETEGVLIYDLGNRQWNIPELRTLLEEILPQKKQITDYEVTHNFLSIGERVILLSALEITREKKEEKLILLSIEDITDRKNTIIKLEESKEHFRSLVMQAPVAICILQGKNYTVEVANEHYLHLVDRQADFIGKPLFESIPELETEEIKELLNNVMQTGKPHNTPELEAYIMRDNKIRQGFYNAVYQPIIGNDGTVSGIIVVGNEVTDLVAARKKMEVQTKLFEDMLMTSPGFVATLSGPNHVYELVNAQYQSLFGKREIQGKPIMVALPELEGQGFDKLLDKVYQTGEPYVGINIPITLARDEGLAPEERYFNFSYQPMYDEFKNIYSILVFGYEVTADVIANKKNEENEALNRAVLESSPDCIKMLDAEGRLQYMNTNGLCLLEIDDFKTVENTYWWDMWQPEKQPIIKDAIAKAKSGEKVQLQISGPTAKGTPKWWDIIVLPVHSDGTDKNDHRILSVSRDITKQKLNELKEKELLTRFQNLVVKAPVAICVLRGENYVIEVINKGMYEMWNRTLEETLNKPAFEVLPELIEQGFKELLDNVYKTGERFVAEELPINLKRNGKIENTFVKFVYEPLREANGSISGVMALAHEITEQVVARKKIEESETKFRTLIEDAPVATCLFTGKEMKVEIANDKMLSYWGKGKDVIGKNLADAVPELIGQPFTLLLDEVFSTGIIHYGKNEEAQLEVNGVLNTYYFDYTYKPIRNAGGEVYGIMNMAVDVTEQVLALKRIEESESRFRKMADLMPQKVWTSDTQGNYNYFNKCWLDYTGLDFAELKDWGWKKVIHPDDWVETKTKWEESIITGENFELEHRLCNTEGIYKWHLTRGLLENDEYGNRKMWIGTNTEMQHIKEEEERKGDFLKMVSHELKTPVTSIKGYVQLLLMMLKEQEAAAALFLETPLLRIDSQIKRLSRLISEMLDLSRLEIGKLELQKDYFNLNDLVKETVQDIEFTNTNHAIKLTSDFNGSVYGDKDRIEQVIINIINNAIKYSPANKLVEVNIHREEYNQIAVSVKDYGIGIDAEHQKKIFNRFYRAGGKSEENYAGFGIGLFIAKEIIERHNGLITVKSEKGKGSVFTFMLPLATEKKLLL